jgi:hypothetical protein
MSHPPYSWRGGIGSGKFTGGESRTCDRSVSFLWLAAHAKCSIFFWVCHPSDSNGETDTDDQDDDYDVSFRSAPRQRNAARQPIARSQARRSRSQIIISDDEQDSE